MIKIEQIYKSFGSNEVLKGIDATFAPGKVSLIIGGSGSGKSTLLKCMVGLHEPDKGRVLFDGKDFSKLSFEDRIPIRKEIGMLFQNSALFDSMTAEQNIIFSLDMFTEMSKSEKLDRANFCLERVNLKGRNKLYPSELSGGMKKRVGIARAIAMSPKYLFCDEPNSGLDPETSILIDELILELTEEYNATTIVVTHDMNSVMGIGEYILYLYKGQSFGKVQIKI
ncbi:phosphonate ABC transporter ATP-binding protein [Sphingobacterium sp. IITKGP-BTPF85]|nr:phosphonate ABC transporter ATP-binding protein [Sphingobacterium sp. IITKGP-BTPF85]